MSYTTKPFEDLDLMDDFLMNAAAGDNEVGEEFSRTLLETLLQRELGEIRISIQSIRLPDSPNHRGIRLDVEINEYETKDGKTILKNIYDLEPNKRSTVDLPKHNRFYQAKIDSRNMKSGENDFSVLPNLFIIMITDYDPFGYDYMMYTVHNGCDEVPELKYDDGLVFLYFNTTGTKGGNSSIKSLLNFIQNSKINSVTDEVTKKLHECVNRVKVSQEMREEYMKWESLLYYERMDGKEEGRLEELLRQVEIKSAKNKEPEQIADELELTIEEVEELLQILKKE
ncbi:MAG: hypothetical protein IJO60_05140 [Agathobacter sp.]|nr:hypothetical protein [Agathobacter sp.]